MKISDRMCVLLLLYSYVVCMCVSVCCLTVICFMSFAPYYVLITRFMFLLLVFVFDFLLCMFCFLFWVLCVFVLFCVS